MAIKIEPLDFELNPELITEGFTQSELTTWDNCPELWYLRYNLMLQKKGHWNWATKFGSWMHSFLEEWILTKGKRANWNPSLSPSELKGVIQNQQWLADREYWEKVGAIIMECYVSHYKHDFDVYTTLPNGVEHVVDFTFEGYRLKGMIDWQVYHQGKKRNFIVDHKSTGRIDKSVLMGWDFRFQFMFYLWVMWKTKPQLKFAGFIPNAIKKPQLRYNPEKEGIVQFAERVRQDILTRPENTFHREIALLKAGDMEHFEMHVLRPKLQRLQIIYDPKIPKDVKMALMRNKNTDYCVKYGASYACQFLDICQKGMSISLPQFTQRSAKHTELESADE